MSGIPAVSWSRTFAGLALLMCLALCGGCIVVDTVAVTGAVAGAVVKTGGEVAVTAVKTTGRVVVTTVRVGADVAQAGAGAAARLSTAGAVVVFQPRTGLAWTMPVGPGQRLSMAEAIGATGLRVARTLLVRNRTDYTVAPSRWAATAVVSGDVIVAQN